MIRRRIRHNRQEHGSGAKSFFNKLGSASKSVIKKIAKPVINALKPVVTTGITSIAGPEALPFAAIGSNMAGDALNNAIQGWGVKLTHHQHHKLMRGGEVTLTRKALLHSRPTHILSLHPERHERLSNLIAANHPKLAMQLHEGEGIKDFFVNTGKKIGKAFAPIAINYGKKAFNDYMGPGYEDIGNVLGDVANQGIQGMGIKSHRRHYRFSGGALHSHPRHHHMHMHHMMHGGAINTHAGFNSNENYINYPIQLGSPYQKMDSPAMNPFIPTHSQLSGYNPIYKRGGSFAPPGHGGGISPPGHGGGSIYPSGYRH